MTQASKPLTQMQAKMLFFSILFLSIYCIQFLSIAAHMPCLQLLVQLSYRYISKQCRTAEVALSSEIVVEFNWVDRFILNVFFLHEISCVLLSQTDFQFATGELVGCISHIISYKGNQPSSCTLWVLHSDNQSTLHEYNSEIHEIHWRSINIF